MRIDIQILRAVAVAGVLLYHFDKNFFPNGFFGVDVFFVISGYLITKQIYEEILSNQFSFKNFYIKRVRRILPALFSTIILSYIIGFYNLSEEHFFELLKAIKYSLAFVANIFFSQTINYFELDTERNLLINLWSLSIEEQFYIVFPIFMIFIYKFLKKYMLQTLGLTILFSIIFNLEVVYEVLKFNKLFFSFEQFIFYSPFTRAWELSLGAVAAVMSHQKKHEYNNSIYLILLTTLLIFKFPLHLQAIYTLLTFLIVLSEKKYSKRLIFLPFIHLGNISYSIYLFHQPILAGIRNHNFFVTPNNQNYFELKNISNFITIMILIYVISLINYLLVENRFRKVSNLSFKNFGFVYFMFFIILVLNFSSDTLYQTVFNQSQKIHSHEYVTKKGTNYLISDDNTLCVNKDKLKDACSYGFGNNSIYILGDSTLASSITGLLSLDIEGRYKIIDYTQTGCMPIIYTCDFFEDSNYFNDVFSIKNSLILIGGDKDIAAFDFNNLEFTIETFIKNNNKVIFFGYLPKPDIDERMYYRKTSKLLVSKNSEFYKLKKIENIEYEEYFNKLYKNPLIKENIYYVNVFNILCDSKICNFIQDGKFLFNDYVHLSNAGAVKIFNESNFLEIIEN